MRRLSEDQPDFMLPNASLWRQVLVISIALALVFSFSSAALAAAVIVLLGQFALVSIGSLFPFFTADKSRVSPDRARRLDACELR